MADEAKSPEAGGDGAQEAGREAMTPDEVDTREALPGNPQVPQAWATNPDERGEIAAVAAPARTDGTVQVKYLVLPEGFSHITSCDPASPAVFLYTQLENELRVDRSKVHISWEGRPLQETDTLKEICQIPESGPLILHLRFDSMPKHLAILNVGEITPGIRTVSMNYGDGIPPKVCTVTLVVAYDHKPFIGGYRSKKDGSVYHHAVVQTDPLEKEVKARTDKVSRDTQTRGKTRTAQTTRECATQMEKKGLCISTEGDVTYHARRYFTASQLHELRVKKIVVIQSHTRGWFARRHACSLRTEKVDLAGQLAEEEDKRRVAHEQKRQREIERRTHPRTARDFATLYNELEAWRLKETERIKASCLTKEDTQLALQEVLKKETKLLQTIHRLQNAANKENKEHRVKQLLQGMTSLKKWGNVCAAQCDVTRSCSLRHDSLVPRLRHPLR